MFRDLFLGLFFICGSLIAQEVEVMEPCLERFYYVKLGAGVIGGTPAACTGIGTRIQEGHRAIDISINWSGATRGYHVTAPKILYLHYLTPEDDGSFYFGGGLSYGATRSEKKKAFHGLNGELAAGYEFHRTSRFRTFVEANLSQGLLATSSKHRHTSAALTVALGVGF